MKRVGGGGRTVVDMFFFPLILDYLSVAIFSRDAAITLVSFPGAQVAPSVSPLRSSLWMPLEAGT